MIPLNDLDALFLGTVEFTFCPHARTEAEARLAGWISFGNQLSADFDPGTQTVERKTCLRGLLGMSGKRIVAYAPRYSLELDEIGRSEVLRLFGARDYERTLQVTTPHPPQPEEPPAAEEFYADDMAFSLSQPTIPRLAYDLTYLGQRIRPVLSVEIDGLLVNKDFYLDEALGQITFTDGFTTTLSPRVVAAKRDSAPTRQEWSELFTQQEVRGLGRMTYFDAALKEPTLIHENFPCTLQWDGFSVDPEAWTTYRLTVALHPPYGTITRPLRKWRTHTVTEVLPP